jgi:NAD(P)-dependent dehydrogenase (short-subunit alcohol dehydrogenase family)
MEQNTVRGRTALVTGAAVRVGHEIALALADEGANVVVHYRNSKEEAESFARELADRGVKSWTVRADFEKPEEYTSLIRRTLDLAGSLDVLVNNASIFPRNTLQDVDFPSVVRNMEVNAWVPFELSREFARLAGRGDVVNLLDARIFQYDWSHVAYILSKHMLAVLTEMTALEFAPDIRVNAVAPALILPSAGMSEEAFRQLARTVPLQRDGSPEDIARAVVYLLRAGFLTGMTINVDAVLHLMEYRNGPPRHS